MEMWLSMVAPMSPTIANMYKEWFEEYKIMKIHKRSKLWALYTRKFSWTSEQTGTIHRIYNKDGKVSALPFLDVEIENFHLNHCYLTKKGNTETLTDQPKIICSISDALSSGKQNLKIDLLRNGYAEHLIYKTIDEYQIKQERKK